MTKKKDEAGTSWLKDKLQLFLAAFCVTIPIVIIITMCESKDKRVVQPKQVQKQRKVIGEETKRSYVKVGEKGFLWNPPNQRITPNIVHVAVDRHTIEATSKALRINDTYGIMELWTSERLLNPFVNTRVFVIEEAPHWWIEVGKNFIKVRILEGTHAGRTGWVPKGWVVRRKRR